MFLGLPGRLLSVAGGEEKSRRKLLAVTADCRTADRPVEDRGACFGGLELDALRIAWRIEMATARLRLFPYQEEEQEEVGTPSIPIRLSDLYPLLAQAYRDNYVWLRDFEDDRLMVSSDLYEVIRAFSNCRPSA